MTSRPAGVDARNPDCLCQSRQFRIDLGLVRGDLGLLGLHLGEKQGELLLIVGRGRLSVDRGGKQHERPEKRKFFHR